MSRMLCEIIEDLQRLDKNKHHTTLETFRLRLQELAKELEDLSYNLIL